MGVWKGRGMNKMEKLGQTFNKIKKWLNNGNDIKMEVEGFYFNTKAVEFLRETSKDFFINSYYNLLLSDILNMIDDNDNIIEVKEELEKEYEKMYAEAWYNNFIEILERTQKKNKIVKEEKYGNRSRNVYKK